MRTSTKETAFFLDLFTLSDAKNQSSWSAWQNPR